MKSTPAETVARLTTAGLTWDERHLGRRTGGAQASARLAFGVVLASVTYLTHASPLKARILAMVGAVEDSGSLVGGLTPGDPFEVVLFRDSEAPDRTPFLKTGIYEIMQIEVRFRSASLTFTGISDE